MVINGNVSDGWSVADFSALRLAVSSFKRFVWVLFAAHCTLGLTVLTLHVPDHLKDDMESPCLYLPPEGVFDQHFLTRSNRLTLALLPC